MLWKMYAPQDAREAREGAAAGATSSMTINQNIAIMQDGSQHCPRAAGPGICDNATPDGITESWHHCWIRSTPGSCPWASSKAWATVWDPRAAAMCSAVDPRESQGVWLLPMIWADTLAPCCTSALTACTTIIHLALPADDSMQQLRQGQLELEVLCRTAPVKGEH